MMAPFTPYMTEEIYRNLTKMESVHLGNWPKPNELSDLLASYNDTLLILTILFPCIALILTEKSIKDTQTLPKKETSYSRPVIITSFLWFSVPFIFWLISHISQLNLFVDRYFIPKEVAVILLVAYGLSFIFQKLSQQKFKSIPLLSALGLSLVLILISTKRAAFGLDKNTNFHHSLIIEETYAESEQTIIIDREPIYFPNAYKNSSDFIFLIKDDQKKELYIQFSKRLNILKH